MSATRRLTLDEYDRMFEQGVLDETQDTWIELIHGEVRKVSQHEPPHEHIINFIIAWSMFNNPASFAWIRKQNSIEIPPSSVPRPDIAWVARKSYRHHRPLPEDVFLVIEVADSTLEDDRLIKGPLYAEGGIAEYWVVNIPGRCVEVHRNPENGTYRDIQSYGMDKAVRRLMYPEVELPVAELFTG